MAIDKDKFELIPEEEIRKLETGAEVIVESLRWDYTKGSPKESKYYRTIVSGHMTTAGFERTLVADPTWEFPEFARWQLGWIYAENTKTIRLWRRKKNG